LKRDVGSWLKPVRFAHCIQAGQYQSRARPAIRRCHRARAPSRGWRGGWRTGTHACGRAAPKTPTTRAAASVPARMSGATASHTASCDLADLGRGRLGVRAAFIVTRRRAARPRCRGNPAPAARRRRNCYPQDSLGPATVACAPSRASCRQRCTTLAPRPCAIATSTTEARAHRTRLPAASPWHHRRSAAASPPCHSPWCPRGSSWTRSLRAGRLHSRWLAGRILPVVSVVRAKFEARGHSRKN
jgi:hypothetical protein